MLPFLTTTYLQHLKLALLKYHNTSNHAIALALLACNLRVLRPFEDNTLTFFLSYGLTLVWDTYCLCWKAASTLISRLISLLSIRCRRREIIQWWRERDVPEAGDVSLTGPDSRYELLQHCNTSLIIYGAYSAIAVGPASQFRKWHSRSSRARYEHHYSEGSGGHD